MKLHEDRSFSHLEKRRKSYKQLEIRGNIQHEVVHDRHEIIDTKIN